jgi:hypothetical protein
MPQNIDFLDYIWVAVGTLFALPGVVFIAYNVAPRLRFASALGAFIGGVLGYLVTMFVWGTPLDSVHLEGAVVGVTSFFISFVTGLIGAMLVSFLAGGSQKPRSTQVEY